MCIRDSRDPHRDLREPDQVLDLAPCLIGLHRGSPEVPERATGPGFTEPQALEDHLRRMVVLSIPGNGRQG